MNKIIGIIGFQGSIEEHQNVLSKLNISTIIVTYSNQIDYIDALIIPGGESTVLNKFIKEQKLLDRLHKFINIEQAKKYMESKIHEKIQKKYELGNKQQTQIFKWMLKNIKPIIKNKTIKTTKSLIKNKTIKNKK